MKHRSKLVPFGTAVLAAFVAVALFAPAISPYDPKALSGASLEPPSARHLLGTNDLGQDILSELIWGSRHSLVVAIGAAVLVITLGVLIGAGSALLGGAAERLVMRMVDIFLALPLLPLLMVVAAFVGTSRIVLILVLGFFGWPLMARIVRAQTLSLRKRGFVFAARGFGGGTFYVIRRHLAPALGPIIGSGFAFIAGLALLLESGLAFLGLGDPAGLSWGTVLNRALNQPGLFYSDEWTWWVLPAGLTITVVVLAFTFLAIGLDPRFNPRSRRAT